MSLGKQMFRGDAPHLVDMLIQASQARPQPVPLLEGRELVKWCDDSCSGAVSAMLDGPLESSNRRQQQQQYASGGKFPARQQARSPIALAAAAAATHASKRSRVASSSSSSPAQIPQRAAAGGAGRRMSADYNSIPAGFACPAVAASPKPEALPMPTGLMSRALAVRSRSPSPPKDSFFAVSALAHVRPVAA